MSFDHWLLWMTRPFAGYDSCAVHCNSGWRIYQQTYYLQNHFAAKLVTFWQSYIGKLAVMKETCSQIVIRHRQRLFLHLNINNCTENRNLSSNLTVWSAWSKQLKYRFRIFRLYFSKFAEPVPNLASRFDTSFFFKILLNLSTFEWRTTNRCHSEVKQC